jgi:hypothetical protein
MDEVERPAHARIVGFLVSKTSHEQQQPTRSRASAFSSGPPLCT